MLGEERGASEGRWRRWEGRFLLLVIPQGEGEADKGLLQPLLLLTPHLFRMAGGGRLATTAVPSWLACTHTRSLGRGRWPST